MELTLAASADPTPSDEVNVEALVVAQLELDASAVQGFSVASTQMAAAAADAAGATRGGARALASYEWVAVFSVVADLSRRGGTSSDFAAEVAAELGSAGFQETIVGGVASVVAVEAVNSAAATRRPTPPPTVAPTIEPASDSGGAAAALAGSRSGVKGGADSASSGGALLLAAAAAAGATALGALGCAAYHRSRSDGGSGEGDGNGYGVAKKGSMFGLSNPAAQRPSLLANAGLSRGGMELVDRLGGGGGGGTSTDL